MYSGQQDSVYQVQEPLQVSSYQDNQNIQNIKPTSLLNTLLQDQVEDEAEEMDLNAVLDILENSRIIEAVLEAVCQEIGEDPQVNPKLISKCTIVSSGFDSL